MLGLSLPKELLEDKVQMCSSPKMQERHLESSKECANCGARVFPLFFQGIATDRKPSAVQSQFFYSYKYLSIDIYIYLQSIYIYMFIFRDFKFRYIFIFWVQCIFLSHMTFCIIDYSSYCCFRFFISILNLIFICFRRTNSYCISWIYFCFDLFYSSFSCFLKYWWTDIYNAIYLAM